MITSKFSIGQQVRHRLLGYLGVIVDVDAKYSLNKPQDDEMAIDESLCQAPWYHVVTENEQGETMHTYLAEVQLDHELQSVHLDQPSLDALSESIKQQLQSPRLKN